MAKKPVATDYRRVIWDRLEDIACPGEHQNIFGHDGALAELGHAYKSGKMHHAWLVTGQKGVGKATLALAISGHILRNPDIAVAPSSWISPELNDNTSTMIGRGGHPNLLYLSRPFDQKTKKFRSNLTIDEIRRTRAFFGATRGENNWRICIVDTADDMNASATNALLKILEEPPERTIFFVLANSPGQLLPTIRSRCRQLHLRPLTNDDMKSALEGLELDLTSLDQPKLENLYLLSNGSVRKAIILLQLDGLELYQRFSEVLQENNSGSPHWLKAHKLAEELSRKNKEDHYRLILDIARNHVSDILHLKASAASLGKTNIRADMDKAQSVLSHLARLCEVWEKTASSVSLADSYNLDKKQVLLNLFGSLAQVR